jgi:hypothetical protein
MAGNRVLLADDHSPTRDVRRLPKPELDVVRLSVHERFVISDAGGDDLAFERMRKMNTSDALDAVVLRALAGGSRKTPRAPN